MSLRFEADRVPLPLSMRLRCDYITSFLKGRRRRPTSHLITLNKYRAFSLSHIHLFSGVPRGGVFRR